MTDDVREHAGPDGVAGGAGDRREGGSGAGGDAADTDGALHRVDVDEAPGGGNGGPGDGRGGQLAGAHPERVDRQFDWRGWILVGMIFVSFLVIPGIILLYPHLGPRLGLTFWDTYLALPLIPAVVLALLAVWATTRP